MGGWLLLLDDLAIEQSAGCGIARSCVLLVSNGLATCVLGLDLMPSAQAGAGGAS
jgi:hypothetical protein